MDKLCELSVTSLALSLCVCICTFCLYRFRIGSHYTESIVPTVFCHNTVVFYVIKRLLRNSTLMAAQYSTP